MRLTDFGIARTIERLDNHHRRRRVGGHYRLHGSRAPPGRPGDAVIGYLLPGRCHLRAVGGQTAVRGRDTCSDARGRPLNRSTRTCGGWSRSTWPLRWPLGCRRSQDRRPASAGEFADGADRDGNIGSWPPSRGSGATVPPPAAVGGSEEPTLVGGPPLRVDPEPVAPESRRSRWPVLVLALALVGLSVAALTNDRSPGGPERARRGPLGRRNHDHCPCHHNHHSHHHDHPSIHHNNPIGHPGECCRRDRDSSRHAPTPGVQTERRASGRGPARPGAWRHGRTGRRTT